MNPKLARLLNEGFSINTLENLTLKQIGVLYSKINEASGSVKMAADKADPAKIKTLTDQGINVEIGENEEELGEEDVNEKAKSQKQQKLMGLALDVKKGNTPKSKVSKKVKDISKDMTKKDLKDFASTKHKGLPIYAMEQEDTDEDHDVNVKNIEESILNIIEKHLPPHTTKGELLKTIRRK